MPSDFARGCFRRREAIQDVRRDNRGNNHIHVGTHIIVIIVFVVFVVLVIIWA